jgi:hypothetical protein
MSRKEREMRGHHAGAEHRLMEHGNEGELPGMHEIGIRQCTSESIAASPATTARPSREWARERRDGPVRQRVAWLCRNAGGAAWTPQLAVGLSGSLYV